MNALLYEGNKKFRLVAGTLEPPGKDMVQVKVAFCGICGTDIHIYHGKMDHRIKMPQVIGHEAAGEVVATGEGVTQVRVGDRVAVRPLQPGAPDPSDNDCAHIGRHMKFIGIDSPGGMQTYWNVPAYTLHKLPPHLPLQLGAMIEPLAVACHDVRLAGLLPGQNAVVIGGGPIGMLIALVARYRGAIVIVSEPNAQRRALCSSLALPVVDPVKEKLAERVAALTGEAMADVVFEVSGTQAGVSEMTGLLRARGRIVMVAIHSEPRPVDLFRFFWREISMTGARVYEPEDFEAAIEYASSGVLPLERLITQVSPLSAAQQAFESIEKDPSVMKWLLDCSR